METLCGKAYSKSTVSEACKELDKKVKEFREKPLTGLDVSACPVLCEAMEQYPRITLAGNTVSEPTVH